MSIPKLMRQLVLQRAKGICEDCGERRRLELHHKNYRNVGDEDPDDLAALCRECHLQRHLDMNGDFWADPEDKEDYWLAWTEGVGWSD